MTKCAFYVKGDHEKARPMITEACKSEDSLTKGLAMNAKAMLDWFSYKPFYPETEEMQKYRQQDPYYSDPSFVRDVFLKIPETFMQAIYSLEQNSTLDEYLKKVHGGDCTQNQLSDPIFRFTRPETLTVILNLCEYWLRYRKETHPGVSIILSQICSHTRNDQAFARALYLGGMYWSTTHKGDGRGEMCLRKSEQVLEGKTCYEAAEAYKYLAMYLDSLDDGTYRGGEIEQLVDKAKTILGKLPYWSARGVHLSFSPLDY